MRMYCLIFLIFFVVNSVLTHVAALNPSDAPRSKATATATTTEELSKTNDAAVNLRALNGWNDEERGPVLDSIFGAMKKALETLMGYIRSFLSRFRQEQPVEQYYTLVHGNREVPLSDMAPETVLKMFQSEEHRLYIGLQATAIYRNTRGKKAFSVRKTVRLLEQCPVKDEAVFARVFAKLMDHPDWKKFAEAVQIRRFRRMIKRGVLPNKLERLLLPPGSPHPPDRSIVDLPKDDPIFRAYRAFTLTFFGHYDPVGRVKMESFFSMTDGAKAAEYVTRLENKIIADTDPNHNLVSE